VPGRLAGRLQLATGDNVLVEEHALHSGRAGAVVDLIPDVPNGWVRIQAGLDELPLGLGEPGDGHC
jgi:hypothetical protein